MYLPFCPLYTQVMRHSKIYIAHNQKDGGKQYKFTLTSVVLSRRRKSFKSILYILSKNKNILIELKKNIISIFKKYGISKEIEMSVKT